jgi:hypothetical protein
MENSTKHKEMKAMMKSRIIALCWFVYIVGVTSATKGFEARYQYEICTIWHKLYFLFVVAVTMLMAFDAGRESKNDRLIIW